MTAALAQLSFSRGKRIKDNRPVARTAANMADFIAQLDADRAPRKDGAAYICGPMLEGSKRGAESALPRAWVALDLDRIEAPVLPDVQHWAAAFDGCGWMTHSSTPEAPRARIIIMLERPANRAECIAIGARLERELDEQFGSKVKLDVSTFRPEQPVHVPPTGAEIRRFTGSALAVPEVLNESRSIAQKAESEPCTEERRRAQKVLKTSSVSSVSSVQLAAGSMV